MYLTGERNSMGQYAALFGAVQNDRLFRFPDLAEAWPDQQSDVEVAYAQSVAFVGFLVERHGGAPLGAVIDSVGAGEPFETAFAKAFKLSLRMEEEAWRAQLPGRYSFLPLITGGTTVMALAAAICATAYLFVRGRKNRRLVAMAAEDAAEDAALRIIDAEAALFAPSSEEPPAPPRAAPSAAEAEPSSAEGSPKPTLH